MDGVGSCLWKVIQYPVVRFGVSMGLVWFWEACLLMLSVVFLFCWRISVGCLALEFAGSWVELGLSVGMEAFGSHLLIFPGVRSSTMFQNSGIELYASGFWSQSVTVASQKTIPLG